MMEVPRVPPGGMTSQWPNVTDAPTSTDEMSEAFKAVPAALMVICMVIWCIEVIVGVVANISVCYILTHPPMASTKTIPLLSLAISDTIWLLCLPLCTLGFQLQSQVFIKLVFAVMWITRPVLIWNLVFIAAQRYVLIVHSQSRLADLILRRPVVIGMSVGVWVITNVVSFALSVTEDFRMRTSHSFSSTVVYFVLEFVFPLVCISVCYALIGRYVMKSLKTLSGKADDEERYGRTLKVLGVLVVTFCVAWLPWNICLLVITSSDHPATPALMITVTIGLTLIFGNSALNPYLYCYVADDFKRQFRRILCCGRCMTSADREELSSEQGLRHQVKRRTMESAVEFSASANSGKLR